MHPASMPGRLGGLAAGHERRWSGVMVRCDAFNLPALFAKQAANIRSHQRLAVSHSMCLFLVGDRAKMYEST